MNVKERKKIKRKLGITSIEGRRLKERGRDGDDKHVILTVVTGRNTNQRPLCHIPEIIKV